MSEQKLSEKWKQLADEHKQLAMEEDPWSFHWRLGSMAEMARQDIATLETRLEVMGQGLEEWHAEMAQAANDTLHFIDERNGIRIALAAFHQLISTAQQEQEE